MRLAEANAAANGLSDRAAFFRDDAGAFMAAAAERGDAWDVVVLDPPKLAPSRCDFWGEVFVCGAWCSRKCGRA